MLKSKLSSFLHQDILKHCLLSSNNLHTTSICYKKNNDCGSKSVAVILCGCGALDGTEISEAISVAIHCSQKGFAPEFYAPEVDICEVVDHCTKEVTDENRKSLKEAARLARSSIKPLCECSTSSAAALIIPGGFGATNTLSNFASEGSNCTVLPDLERIIHDFSCNKKPIGSICISAALVAKVLKGVKITLGKQSPEDKWPYSKAIEKVRKMGAKVQKRDVKGVTHCKKYNVFSTPAWMYSAASHHEIHIGIGKMITKMNKYMK